MPEISQRLLSQTAAHLLIVLFLMVGALVIKLTLTRWIQVRQGGGRNGQRGGGRWGGGRKGEGGPVLCTGGVCCNPQVEEGSLGVFV